MNSRIIAGKYELLRTIGRGGMSVLYLAKDLRLGHFWVVKEVRRECRSEKERIRIRSILSEVRILTRLDHPGLPRIVDFYETRQAYYVVMDRIDGVSLEKLVQEQMRHGSSESAREILERCPQWMLQLCEIMIYLHAQGIIYRDLKPGNVMVRRDGRICLLDFGACLCEDSGEEERSLGTPGFAAPEQLCEEAEADERTDIYGFGRLWIWVFERVPETAGMQQEAQKWERIFSECTREEPGDRIGSFALLKSRLEETAGSRGKKKWKKKTERRFAAAACVILLLLSAGNNAWGRYEVRQTLAYAQMTSDPQEKLNLLLQSAENHPREMSLWEKCFEAVREDGIFSEEEEQQILRLYERCGSLADEEAPGEAAFSIGCLYWFYSPQEEPGGFLQAQPWFQEAADCAGEQSALAQEAKRYASLGAFYRDIAMRTTEGTESGMYRECFAQLQDLMALAGQEAENDAAGGQEVGGSPLLRLEICRICLYSVENYASGMERDGITEGEALNFTDEVLQYARSLPAEGERPAACLEEILESETLVKEAVKRVYGGRNSYAETQMESGSAGSDPADFRQSAAGAEQ